MQGFYDAHARDTEIDMSGQDSDGRTFTADRRGHPDRRKKDRRQSKSTAKAGAKSSATGLLQPILTEAEIAALLRGAR